MQEPIQAVELYRRWETSHRRPFKSMITTLVQNKMSIMLSAAWRVETRCWSHYCFVIFINRLEQLVYSLAIQ